MPYKFLTLTFLVLHSVLFSQTIAEKKAGLGQHLSSGDLSEEMRATLTKVNEELEILENELKALYKQAGDLYQSNASTGDYKALLSRINKVRDRRALIETQWRELATKEQLDGYALWHQPSTTLEQLIIDYGSEDFVYLIPPDIAEIPLSVNSNLPIPRASWNEMLEMILTQNGVGIKQLNPYLRQLYLIKKDNSGLKLITNRRNDLEVLPPNEHIAFMLSPEPSDVRRVWFFLEKFVNPNSVVLQQIGRDILIIADVVEIQELLKLYDFISANRGDKEYRVLPLFRVNPTEMTKVLNAIFGVLTEEPSRSLDAPQRQVGKPQPLMSGRGPNETVSRPSNSGGDNGLQVIPLTEIASAIFLIGTREEIRKAEGIIRDVEEQVGETQGRTIYWYTAKHAEAEELADVLFRIYNLMITRQVGFEGPDIPEGTNVVQDNINIEAPEPNPPPPPLLPVPGTTAYPPISPYQRGLYQDGGFVVNRVPPQPRPPANVNRDNFIVDLKTGTIVMVVEIDILPKIKELIRKLDVPKKMVQLEVLLFEKRLNFEDDYGLQLLKAGFKASDTNKTGATFNVINALSPVPGIFDFFISRKASNGFPAFDAVYRFLLSQENIHINASPSVLAINQTPAIIEIDEEISVNTGVYNVNTVGGPALEKVFARARYGIVIEITPSIHTQDDEECFYLDTEDYVTLATDITFQSFTNNLQAQPNVTTRHIVNEVNIPDGQTVILGGLRQRNTRDAVNRIPFLGDIPGVGKLFSNTAIKDDSTEMFIFITPKIIYDPAEDLERIKMIEMTRRPGDIPAFLCSLLAAQCCERDRLFHSTLTILLGRMPERCVCPPGEYDGR